MSTQSRHTVVLQAEPSIRDAARLSAELMAAIASHEAVLVDAAEVASVDIGVLQLFIAAHKSAHSAGRKFSVKASAGGAVRKALAASGIDVGARLAWEGEFWTGLGNPAQEQAV